MTRFVVLDTETTGLDPYTGDRIIEIGCVEVVSGFLTGRNFHVYINPLKQVNKEAFAVHGISDEFLRDKPIFSDIVADFSSFISDATLVIHNATFDMKFLNHEFSLLKLPKLENNIIDTLTLARAKFPGSPASLDALCKRFKIDLSSRDKHGALVDSELLANVFVMIYSESDGATKTTRKELIKRRVSLSREYKVIQPSEEELAAHTSMLSKIKAPIWFMNDQS